MEEAKKRVYGRREVRMFLAYDGQLSKSFRSSKCSPGTLKRISPHHAVGTVLSAHRGLSAWQ